MAAYQFKKRKEKVSPRNQMTQCFQNSLGWMSLLLDWAMEINLSVSRATAVPINLMKKRHLCTLILRALILMVAQGLHLIHLTTLTDNEYARKLMPS